MWLLVPNHTVTYSPFTNCISFVKLTRSNLLGNLTYPLPSQLASASAQLPGVSLAGSQWVVLQRSLCWDGVWVPGSVRGLAAAGWGDNSQPLVLREFLRELQAAMNSLAFGREVLQRSLPLCSLGLNLMKETSPEPKRLWRARGGGLLGDKLSCVQIPLGWPWGERLFSRTTMLHL